MSASMCKHALILHYKSSVSYLERRIFRRPLLLIYRHKFHEGIKSASSDAIRGSEQNQEHDSGFNRRTGRYIWKRSTSRRNSPTPTQQNTVDRNPNQVEEDFFGITQFESVRVAHEENQESTRSTLQNTSSLAERLRQKLGLQRDAEPGAEDQKVYKTSFGYVRYDSDNQVSSRRRVTECTDVRQSYSGGDKTEATTEDTNMSPLTMSAELTTSRVGENTVNGNMKTEDTGDLNPLDEQYFAYQPSTGSDEKHTWSHHETSLPETEAEKGNQPKDLNPIDEYYFAYEPSTRQVENQPEVSSCNDHTNHFAETAMQKNDVAEDGNLFDEQYFGMVGTAMTRKTESNSQCDSYDFNGRESRVASDRKFAERHFSAEETSAGEEAGSFNKLYSDSPTEINNTDVTDQQHNQTELAARNLDEKAETILTPALTKEELRRRLRPKPDLENPKTAFDMAMKVRSELKHQKGSQKQQILGQDIPDGVKYVGKEKLDSKGFNILTNQVQDLTWLSEDDVYRKLWSNILYNDNEIVAFNKPYGIPVHGGKGVHHSVDKYLPRIAKKLDSGRGIIDQLYLLHRLDQNCTGVLVCATTQKMAHRVQEMFKTKDIIKKYWAITIRVPDPREGIINIPMAEGTVDGKFRMTLKPEWDEEKRAVMQHSYVRTHAALTEYRVLDSSSKAALVEVQPVTGVKHQIRCHLSFALSCPILGDHKYSNLGKLVPQRLPAELLTRLHIRQAKVRHVAMHLHAKSIVIPEVFDGKNVVINCNLPSHFAQNMKRLKLKPPTW
ncbi:PREDICTED: uncharacterized protein LOC106811571 [Priapulus caudatus]|uniref:Pseudouridylate synthase RPUSD4, mitochondrial n=1 Tax=Priapulus caudatus TaxID=37621 RepID=A0ABM1EEV8_PRICU|nr:PREDICTED: uncharacterized protein LOC106811571 [Priapulus caudatus]